MIKSIPAILTTAITLLYLVPPSFGQSNTEKFPKPSRENSVNHPSEFEKKVWLARKQRDDVVEYAIYALREMAPTETAAGDYYESLFVLSRFRATEGIEILSKRLLYEPEANAARRTYDNYPVSGVLTAIGQPAIPAMLQVIRDPNASELERRIACWVLLSIEASSDPDVLPDDDVVKEMVLQRISRLQYLRDPETLGVSAARQFIEHFAETEGRWQELPVIFDGPNPVYFGKSINHQFRCQKPVEHPEATIEFKPNEQLEELGLTLSKSGKLTGTPKAPGTYRFTISAKAIWKTSSGKDIHSLGAARFGLGVHTED